MLRNASVQRAITGWFAAIAIMFLSCNSGKGDQEAAGASGTTIAAPVAYDTLLAKGAVIDSISCKGNSRHSYALYLPSYYTKDKSFPCICFFDAHARGAMPVKMYKDLAEKYGFILAGSNISKNGTPPQELKGVISIFMDDLRSRFNIDGKRVYTAGFSGGARVAASVAIFDGGIAGVIGCAAGFPRLEQNIQDKFNYFGIVGEYDFNLTEMEKLDEMLQQNGFHHQLLTTGEIHSWATAPDFKTAMLWMQVNAMKEGLQPKDDTISNSLKSDYKQRIAKAISSKDWMKAHQLLEGIVATLGGLTDVSSEKKQLEEMSAGTNYKNAVALQHQIQQAEMKQQSELAQQFAAQDEQWWQKKIGELNHSSKTAKTGQEAQMYKRLINYLGLVGYMYSSQAINKGDLNHANTFLHIFKMADPKNPDCSYLIALYDMKKGNPDQAIAALQEAASLGYSEAAMMNDPVFAGIRDNPGYKEAVNKVIGNHSAK